MRDMFESMLNEALFDDRIFIADKRCGKSYMMDMMAQYYRKQGKEVTVLNEIPKDNMSRSPILISTARLELGDKGDD